MPDIREGLISDLHTMSFIGDDMELDYDDLANRILTHLCSQGVVQKVEGELPTFNPDLSDSGNILVQHGYKLSTKDMSDLGYTLTKEIE